MAKGYRLVITHFLGLLAKYNYILGLSFVLYFACSALGSGLKLLLILTLMDCQGKTDHHLKQSRDIRVNTVHSFVFKLVCKRSSARLHYKHCIVDGEGMLLFHSYVKIAANWTRARDL